MALTSGQMLGHLRVLEQIGAGGMGEVYLAEDTRLERRVALKVVPEEFASDQERLARFEREAKALAALNHPHIVTIHSVEEAEAGHFITMELVEGDTLAERIPTGGMTLDAFLDLATPLAEALAAAHERGITHRDLKPSNIMINHEGRLKVLDFGLAKLRRPPGDWHEAETGADTDTLSREGSFLGTLPYMSPEQVEGLRVDHRSDLFSLGTMLYEMATGQRPFKGETPAALASSILRDDPPPVTALNHALPTDLDRIVSHCLRKDPERRYQTAKDLRNELEELRQQVVSGAVPVPPVAARPRRWPVALAAVTGLVILALAVVYGGRLWERFTGGAVPAAIRSIAVLPLENLSGDPEQEYFADGMTDSLITGLSKIGALQVVSRTSSMRFKGLDKPLPEIARELNVDAVVEGSVLREADRVRVTVQLIEGATDRHIWAESYERELTSVLALQGEVARTIAGEIHVELTPQEETRLVGARAVNPETYQAYLKGMYFLRKGTPEDSQRGLAYLQQAVDNDPADPLAYAGLALGYSVAGHGFAPSVENFPRAKAAALKALELDDTLAEAHAAMAEVKLYYDWDWIGAEKAFQRAFELNSSLALAHAHYSWYLFPFGRLEDALAEAKRAQELDPLSAHFTAYLGAAYWWAGQVDRAMDEARKALELNPGHPLGLYLLGAVYAEKGMFEEAIAAHQEARAIRPDLALVLGHTYALAGRRDEALRVVAESGEDYLQRNPWGVAEIYTALGEKDEAFRWLDVGYENRYNMMPWIGETPTFEPLRDDPRFQELLRRMNLSAS
jgi:serine/threonine-protein kinase